MNKESQLLETGKKIMENPDLLLLNNSVKHKLEREVSVINDNLNHCVEMIGNPETIDCSYWEGKRDAYLSCKERLIKIINNL